MRPEVKNFFTTAVNAAPKILVSVVSTAYKKRCVQNFLSRILVPVRARLISKLLGTFRYQSFYEKCREI